VAPVRTGHVREVHGLTAVAKKSKDRKQSRKQQLAEQMVVEQQRTAEVLQALSNSLGAQNSSSGDRLLEEIRKLLDDVLVAQHRTNQLLELALRAGFEDDEQARTS
jgi:hypothetical protein